MKIEPKKNSLWWINILFIKFFVSLFSGFLYFYYKPFSSVCMWPAPWRNPWPPTSPNTIRGPSHHTSADKTDNSCHGVFYANVMGFFPVRTTCELLRLTIEFSVFFFFCIFLLYNIKLISINQSSIKWCPWGLSQAPVLNRWVFEFELMSLYWFINWNESGIIVITQP